MDGAMFVLPISNDSLNMHAFGRQPLPVVVWAKAKPMCNKYYLMVEAQY
jgi:hypothetical protein